MLEQSLSLQLTLLYTLPLIAATALLLGLIGYIWRRRHVPGGWQLILLGCAGAIWSAFYALELAMAAQPIAVLWAKFQYVGIVTVPVAWLLFAWGYGGRTRQPSRTVLLLLWVVPLVTLALVWTNELHHLVWPNISLDTSALIPVLKFAHGPVFWINNIYAQICMLLGAILLVRGFLRAPRIFVRQVAALISIVMAPWLGNVIYILGLNPLKNLDLTPFGIAVAAIVATFGFWRYRVLDIVPIARDLVLDQIVECILVLDAQQRVVDGNAAAWRFLNAQPGPSVGQSIAVVLQEWPELARHLRAYTQLSAEETAARDGMMSFFEVYSTPVLNRQGQVSGWLLSWRDISALKRSEAALRQQNAELLALQSELVQAKDSAEAANRAKSVFLANMSHELRTPLTAILGYTNLIHLEATMREDAALLRDLDAIQISGAHLLNLINSLLDLAKLEAGKVEIFIEAALLSQLLDSVVTTVQPLVAQNHNTLVVESECPSKIVYTDIVKMSQVLLNLLSNAAKFTEHGTITLRVRNEIPSPADPAAPDGWMCFDVIDTGIGIDPELLPRLFVEFLQGDNARKYGGTGLGLTLSRRLCHLLGGDLRVESDLGHGATFTARVPILSQAEVIYSAAAVPQA